MTTDGNQPSDAERAGSAAKAAEKAAATAEENAAQAALTARSVTALVDTANKAKASAETAAADAERAASKQPWPYLVTLVLVLICVGAAIAFGVTTPSGGDPRAVEASHRMHITTLVCFLGMAFACLGFGLFLVGATGAFKGSTTGSGKAINIETAAPGLVVMVCATIVIYLALDVFKPAAPGSPPESRGSGATPPPDAGAAAVDATVGLPPIDAQQ